MSILKKYGVEESFERLYREYSRLMLWKARQILGNEEDAEDCVQTAFMRIIKNFSHIEKNISPKTATQLVIITRNIAIDMLRKRRRDETIELTEDISCPKDEINEMVEKNALYQSMEKLPQEMRDVLYMYYIYGLDVKVIARLFNVKEGSVYKKLERAKERLKEIIEGNEHG